MFRIIVGVDRMPWLYVSDVPRRVYSNDHMRAVADGIKRVYDRRDDIKGLKFV